jgi:hypothetical protein
MGEHEILWIIVGGLILYAGWAFVLGLRRTDLHG